MATPPLARAAGRCSPTRPSGRGWWPSAPRPSRTATGAACSSVTHHQFLLFSAKHSKLCETLFKGPGNTNVPPRQHPAEADELRQAPGRGRRRFVGLQCHGLTYLTPEKLCTEQALRYVSDLGGWIEFPDTVHELYAHLPQAIGMRLDTWNIV